MSNANPDQSHLNRRGRPPGTRNRATIEREAAARAAAAAIAAGLGDAAAADMTPLQVLLLVMKSCLSIGDMAGARAAAEAAAPYCHPRKSAEAAPQALLPADLLPDVDTPPDEPGPAMPVL